REVACGVHRTLDRTCTQAGRDTDRTDQRTCRARQEGDARVCGAIQDGRHRRAQTRRLRLASKVSLEARVLAPGFIVAPSPMGFGRRRCERGRCSRLISKIEARYREG